MTKEVRPIVVEGAGKNTCWQIVKLLVRFVGDVARKTTSSASAKAEKILVRELTR